jgi:hypothetical protein
VLPNVMNVECSELSNALLLFWLLLLQASYEELVKERDSLLEARAELEHVESAVRRC